MEKKYFVLHGHFYQPPRENPWTGLVDRQKTAYPYNDWNTRIEKECYTACTRTSVWEGQYVIKTINCYEYISFNFGATLLEWMEKQGDIQTIHKIVEADKISIERNNGHGNAIAQVYNHLIMPLASERDQYTQIIWGLSDFKRRFGRDSEGMWLGETAINDETARILVDCGIKFVILSPYQAQYIVENGIQKDVLGGRIDTGRPYLLRTKSGDLTVFFYDGGLASGISFGNLLSSAENLRNSIENSFRMRSLNNDIKLVHTATDGEVYGHHKNYGNMALARMIYDVHNGNQNPFEFTNYGKVLSEVPPNIECSLYLGEEGKGSSWSCAHGVGRWYRDCSCHTGGQFNWNQKWRTPIRNAFDLLRDEIHKVAEQLTSSLLKDLWEARNDFYECNYTGDRNTLEKFLEKHQAKRLSSDEKRIVLKCLDSLKYSMLMYTSCGWFFSDISGIETIQDLIYAQIAFEKLEQYLPNDLYDRYLDKLKEAQSNISGTGKDILLQTIEEYRMTDDSLKEYLFWSILRDGCDSEYIVIGKNIELIWSDSELKKYIIRLYNNIGDELYVSILLYGLKEGNRYLIWKERKENFTEEEIESEEFWEEGNYSNIQGLPRSLRLMYIKKSIEHEMEKSFERSHSDRNFILDAVWGVEDLLLPYEKRVLLFHYASKVYRFAQMLLLTEELLYPVELFLQEIELLKKSAESKEEIEVHLEPVARMLLKYLEDGFKREDEKMIRHSNIIYWGIKDSINMHYNDALIEIAYYYKIKAKEKKDEKYDKEVRKILINLGFNL